MTPEEITAEYRRMADEGPDYTPSPEYVRLMYATADSIYVDHRREQFDRMLNAVRAETFREAIQIANDTTDQFGNMYRLDWIDRIEHEISHLENRNPR